MQSILRLLLAIEILSVAAAVPLAVMWAREPSGPYEPWIVLLLLLGGTVIELLRRHMDRAMGVPLSEKQLAELKGLVLDAQLPRSVNSAGRKLHARIRALLESRRQLEFLCEQLASIRGVAPPLLDAHEIVSKLELHPAVHEPLHRFLAFTDRLSGRSTQELLLQADSLLEDFEFVEGHINMLLPEHIRKQPH